MPHHRLHVYPEVPSPTCDRDRDRDQVRRVDEADAVAQQNRHQMDHDLLEQAGT
jgi:hypothetical protein